MKRKCTRSDKVVGIWRILLSFYSVSVLFSISDINNGETEGFLPEEDEVTEEDEVSFPVRASVTIEKVHMK